MEINESPKLAVVTCFLDEEQHLSTLLSSIAAQTEPPEHLLLIDDGSRDSSYEIAAAFAHEHSWARALRRPLKRPSRDRLVAAGELLAFQWGVQQLEEPWDIIAKLDADLQLNAELFQTVRKRFVANSRLGITGSNLSTLRPDGRIQRERNPSYHVRGPNKFYRRACFESISPLPPILGWDTIDDLRARFHGYTTESFALSSGETIHLRPTGAYNGRLRAYRRWGRAAWGYGSHPLWVMLSGVYRMRDRPYVLAGLSYIWGWLVANARRYPRAEHPLRSYTRQEDLARLRHRLRKLSAGTYDDDVLMADHPSGQPEQGTC